jgi:hypothetical protein
MLIASPDATKAGEGSQRTKNPPFDYAQGGFFVLLGVL